METDPKKKPVLTKKLYAAAGILLGAAVAAMFAGYFLLLENQSAV